jgi:outer membrane protein assembly factor BamE (lipoprotein component of BamABCDE complex)
VGFSEGEVQLAAGEPDEEKHGENGMYTWIFKRSNNKLLYVDFNGSGVVEKTYTKDAPKAVAKRSTAKRRTTKKRSSSSWKNGKGTPL